MSHLFRVAVVATSLITCPACATTTTTLTRLDAEAIEAGVEPAGGALRPCGSECQAAAPASQPAAPRWWQGAARRAPTDGSAPLLTWEETRAAAKHFGALTYEPTDSRLRIVLNMNDAPLAAPPSTAGESQVV